MAPTGDQSVFGNYILCPIEVDAFVINEAVCDTGSALIAPVAQPDYGGLRLESGTIKRDIQPNVDVHRAQPASLNPRVTDTGVLNTASVDPKDPAKTNSAPLPVPRENRIGVHVAWTVPNGYRTVDIKDSGDGQTPSKQINRLAPNRWLVVRKIKDVKPAEATVEALTGWVIESDRLWTTSELRFRVDRATDFEQDVSPFTSGVDVNSPDSGTVDAQANTFIGAKRTASGWTEDRSARRVPQFGTLSSANPLFADFALQNCNVFSMVDDFSYIDSNDGLTRHLQACKADYFVLGWHSTETSDPLGAATASTLKDRLDRYDMFLSADSNLNDSKSTTRLLLHGTLSTVEYGRDNKPPSLADDIAKTFLTNDGIEPVSLGVSALDSILTWLNAHRGNADDVLGSGDQSTASSILALSELLLAADAGDYDSRAKAADLVVADHYVASHGGHKWAYDAQPNVGTNLTPTPNRSQFAALEQLNSVQMQLDAVDKKVTSKRAELFGNWFNYVSDVDKDVPSKLATYQKTTASVRSELDKLLDMSQNSANGLRQQRNGFLGFGPPGTAVTNPQVGVKKVPADSFYRRGDPTLCLAGLPSGWSPSFARKTQVKPVILLNGGRRPVEVPSDSSAYLPSSFDANLKAVAWLLLQDFQSDGIGQSGPSRPTRWTQPFRPLFVEWEAVYYHIPIDRFSLSTASSSNYHDQCRYRIRDPLFDQGSPDRYPYANDIRIVSGRETLVPQPANQLQVLVRQVFSRTSNADLPSNLQSEEKQQDLLDRIGKLRFLSTPLSGITDNLLTLSNGTHVAPSANSSSSNTASPSLTLRDGLDAAAPAGFTASDILAIGRETHLTPYGSMVNFSNSSVPPFKGVTHGQLRFTKLNIVDKWGQVIANPTPKPKTRLPSPIVDAVRPCVAEQLLPTVLSDGTLNTVLPLARGGDVGGISPFLQLTPAINQNARLNGGFVGRDLDESRKFKGWRALGEYESPVFGWVSVNYGEGRLQFFTEKGLFYCELRVGGPAGVTVSPTWSPFDPPASASAAVHPQLDALIKAMTSSNPPSSGTVYLQSFWRMLEAAAPAVSQVPSSAVSFKSSLTGKPFALLNIGWSIELAEPPLRAQNTNGPVPKDEESELYGYGFPVKIGDRQRTFDGVVGYWLSGTGNGSTDWSRLYTYFSEKPGGGLDPRVKIDDAGTYPNLNPYYLHPERVTGSMKEAHARQLTITTLIIDPYQSIHAFSGILPTKSLKLDEYSIGVASQTATAFLHAGPLLLSHDVPVSYDPSQPIRPDTLLAKQAQGFEQDGDRAGKVKLPLAVGGAERWRWLQPYLVSGEGGAAASTKYNALDVSGTDGRLLGAGAPYTLVEGFLQLARAAQDVRAVST